MNAEEPLELLDIQLLDADADDAIIADIAAIVNRAYAVGEAGLWRDGAARTTHEELVGLIGAGEIAAARMGETVVGAVRIQRLDGGVGEFGMLAVHPDHQGAGIGRQLVDFAERLMRDDGVRIMQLELLVSKAWTHPDKAALRDWYTRRGYRVVRTGDIAEQYPALAPLLATECSFLIFRKTLA